MASEEPRFLNLDAMSLRLGIPASTLDALVRKGILPQPLDVTGGKKRMWTIRDVDGMAYMLEVIGAKRVRKTTPDDEDIDAKDG